MRAPGRAAGALLAAAAVLGVAAAWPSSDPRPDPRPNLIVILTDDQPAGTFDAMPWLRGELAREGSGWVEFPVAFANTPLCCPSRASLLTGRYARNTGVLDNGDGAALDESATLAVWLRELGYRTGLVGKYLNGYPFGRLPYVPAGWDRFVAKRNQSRATTYRDFPVVDQGSPMLVRRYATDWLAAEAVRFIRTSPPDRPFFLLFAPSAPHFPWVPAGRHRGRYAELSVSEPPNVAGALRGAPMWVRARPEPSAAQRAAWLDERRRAAETLLAVDDAVRAIVGAVGSRLDDTVILLLSDNGYAFGEHRWVGKTCPYEACVRIPFAVRSPWSATAAGPPPLVSVVDVAPTLMALAGGRPTVEPDGRSFAATIRPPATPTGPRPDAVFLGWVGDARMPAWTAVRTVDLKLIRYDDGSEELYDLRGRIGPPDPWEQENRIGEPAYEVVATRLRGLLGSVRDAG